MARPYGPGVRHCLHRCVHGEGDLRPRGYRVEHVHNGPARRGALWRSVNDLQRQLTRWRRWATHDHYHHALGRSGRLLAGLDRIDNGAGQQSRRLRQPWQFGSPGNSGSPSNSGSPGNSGSPRQPRQLRQPRRLFTRLDPVDHGAEQ